MNGGLSIQFRGVENGQLLLTLSAAIALALAAYGLWRWLSGRDPRLGTAALAGGVVSAGVVALAGAQVPLALPAQRALWMLLLLGLILLAVSIFYWAVYAYLGRRRMSALLALRFLAIVALLLILFEPALSYQPSRRDDAPVLVVLVDRSASMGAVDSPDLPSRYRQVIEALSMQQERLARAFRPAWRHFAATVQSVDSADDLASLSLSGEGTDATDIAGALRHAGDGYGVGEMAGIILISDGLHNGGADVLAAARESPVAIYTVGVGSEKESAAGGRNVRLVAVEGPLDAVRNNVTSLAARVRLTGWANIPARVVLGEDGRQADVGQVLTEAADATLTVGLKWTPTERTGGPAGADVRKLRVTVEPNPAESAADDNAADLHVRVTEPSLRVLYVEGTLRPEYKFVNRILTADPNVKVASLVRLGDNHFLAQGELDGKPLAQLPTEAQLKRFDVVILGDLDRTYLKTELMEQIRQFVSDGKGLLMIGGRTSFGPGGYAGTPLEAALPVVVGPRSQAQETLPFVPLVTAAGSASPILAGLEKSFDTPSGKAVQPVPELLGCVAVVSAKPAASVLAVHPGATNASGPLVVLAVQQYGAGRSAAWTADTTWRWHLRPLATGQDRPAGRFWGQLIRWLAGVEKKDRLPEPSVVARLDKACLRQGEDLKITASVRDAARLPASDCAVRATLALEGGKPEEVVLSPGNSAGYYEATYRPVRSGRLEVTVLAADKNAQPLGSDELAVPVQPHSKEHDRLARDTALLQAIAVQRDAASPSAAGLATATPWRAGRCAELSALPEVIDEIARRQKTHLPGPEPVRVYSLYNFPLLFLVFVALLTGEWILRRRWQLQ